MNFSELGLKESIVRAVADQGYTTPTDIQALAIPEALNGRDVLGCAQTGTGKTCAFALPILDRLSDDLVGGRGHGVRVRTPRAIVLCPTRELAMQIYESFIGYGRGLKLRHAVVFGGVPQRNQVRELRAGVDILVATPGRLHDLINQGHIDLRRIEVLVLDEADRMLDMGFIHDIRKVVDLIPETRQTLFFSATVSKEIRKLADSMLEDPARVETAPESSTVDAIAQRAYAVDRANKPELLSRILNQKEVNRALVFTKTKYGADKLVKVLHRQKINAEAIHGDKSQNARTRAMRRFKSGITRVLVATDIASRGIDVDEITHVINYDMPIDVETYVHRIGRTARAGSTGIAISFCDQAEVRMLRAIERRAKIAIEVGVDHPDLVFQASASSSHRKPSSHQSKKSSRFNKPRANSSETRDESPRPRVKKDLSQRVHSDIFRATSSDRPTKPSRGAVIKDSAQKNETRSERGADQPGPGQHQKKSKKKGYPRNTEMKIGPGKSKKTGKNTRKANAGVRKGKPTVSGAKARPGTGAGRSKRSTSW